MGRISYVNKIAPLVELVTLKTASIVFLSKKFTLLVFYVKADYKFYSINNTLYSLACFLLGFPYCSIPDVFRIKQQIMVHTTGYMVLNNDSGRSYEVVQIYCQRFPPYIFLFFE